MWDVKFFNLINNRSLPSCFTLTMWDVKGYISDNTLRLVLSFYLNYVGCKAPFGVFARRLSLVLP